MSYRKIPLLDSNPSDVAVLTPRGYLEKWASFTGKSIPEFPEYAIVTFQYMHVLDVLKEEFGGKILYDDFSYYIFSFHGVEMVFAHVPVGAAATVMTLEELFALGVKNVVLLGRVGVLDNMIPRGGFIIPVKALREEGVSYHYVLPSRYVYPDNELSLLLSTVLKDAGEEFFFGGTWTIDAPYRETFSKIRRYRKEGMLCVEMEGASVFAVSQHRGVRSAALFIGGDSVAGEEWESRRVKGGHEEELRRNVLGLKYGIEALYLLHSRGS